MVSSIQLLNLVIRVQTPGMLASAHPIPHEMIPARNQRPSSPFVWRGPPESPWKQTIFTIKITHLIIFRIFIRYKLKLVLLYVLLSLRAEMSAATWKFWRWCTSGSIRNNISVLLVFKMVTQTGHYGEEIYSKAGEMATIASCCVGLPVPLGLFQILIVRTILFFLLYVTYSIRLSKCVGFCLCPLAPKRAHFRFSLSARTIILYFCIVHLEKSKVFSSKCNNAENPFVQRY